MKKLFASMTAIALVGAMMVPLAAFADGEDFSAPGSGTRDVSWSKAGESYVITIPSSANLAVEESYAISATTLNINPGTTITVTATSAHAASTNDVDTDGDETLDAKAFHAFRAEGDSPAYTFKANGDVKYSGDTVATFTTASHADVPITFEAPTMSWYGGTYSDTITFAIRVGTV
jgi:plastocyanin